MNFIYKIFLKQVALFLAVCLLLEPTTFSQSGYAASINPARNPSREVLTVSNFDVPKSVGSIQEKYQGKSLETIVIIQDAHDVPSAQINIEKIIHKSLKKFDIGFVGLEGAEGLLNAEFYKTFPHAEKLRKEINEWLERGEISGGTAAALFEDESALFAGIETDALYRQGLDLYKKAFEKSSHLAQGFEAQNENLKKEKISIFSEKLLSLETLWSNFQKNGSNLEELLTALFAIKKPDSIYLKSLAENTAFEKMSNPHDQDFVQTTLFKLKNEELSQAAHLKKLNAIDQDLKTGAMNPEKAALELKDFIKKNSIPFEKMDKLEEISKHEKLFSEIKAPELFLELEKFYDSIYQELCSSKACSELKEKSRKLLLAEKLSALEISNKEYQLLKSQYPHVLFAYPDAADFYKNSKRRENVFLDNLHKLKKMNCVSSPASILVVGGFHAEGLTQKLKKQDISYILLSPRIESLSEKDLYREHMLGHVSWEQYLTDEKENVPLYKAFARVVRDRLIEKGSQVSYSDLQVELKRWRDEVLLNSAINKKVSSVEAYIRLIDESLLQMRLLNLEKRKLLFDDFLDKLKGLHDSNQLNPGAISELFSKYTIPSELTGPGLILWNPPHKNRSEIRTENLKALTQSIVPSGMTQSKLREILNTLKASELLRPLERDWQNPKSPFYWVPAVNYSYPASRQNVFMKVVGIAPHFFKIKFLMGGWVADSYDHLNTLTIDINFIDQSIESIVLDDPSKPFYKQWANEDPKLNGEFIIRQILYWFQQIGFEKAVLPDVPFFRGLANRWKAEGRFSKGAFLVKEPPPNSHYGRLSFFLNKINLAPLSSVSRSEIRHDINEGKARGRAKIAFEGPDSFEVKKQSLLFSLFSLTGSKKEVWIAKISRKDGKAAAYERKVTEEVRGETRLIPEILKRKISQEYRINLSRKLILQFQEKIDSVSEEEEKKKLIATRDELLTLLYETKEITLVKQSEGENGLKHVGKLKKSFSDRKIDEKTFLARMLHETDSILETISLFRDHFNHNDLDLQEIYFNRENNKVLHVFDWGSSSRIQSDGTASTRMTPALKPIYVKYFPNAAALLSNREKYGSYPQLANYLDLMGALIMIHQYLPDQKEDESSAIRLRRKYIDRKIREINDEFDRARAAIDAKEIFRFNNGEIEGRASVNKQLLTLREEWASLKSKLIIPSKLLKKFALDSNQKLKRLKFGEGARFITISENGTEMTIDEAIAQGKLKVKYSEGQIILFPQKGVFKFKHRGGVSYHLSLNITELSGSSQPATTESKSSTSAMSLPDSFPASSTGQQSQLEVSPSLNPDDDAWNQVLDDILKAPASPRQEEASEENSALVRRDHVTPPKSISYDAEKKRLYVQFGADYPVIVVKDGQRIPLDEALKQGSLYKAHIDAEQGKEGTVRFSISQDTADHYFQDRGLNITGKEISFFIPENLFSQIYLQRREELNPENKDNPKIKIVLGVQPALLNSSENAASSASSSREWFSLKFILKVILSSFVKAWQFIIILIWPEMRGSWINSEGDTHLQKNSPQSQHLQDVSAKYSELLNFAVDQLLGRNVHWRQRFHNEFLKINEIIALLESLSDLPTDQLDAQAPLPDLPTVTIQQIRLLLQYILYKKFEDKDKRSEKVVFFNAHQTPITQSDLTELILKINSEIAQIELLNICEEWSRALLQLESLLEEFEQIGLLEESGSRWQEVELAQNLNRLALASFLSVFLQEKNGLMKEKKIKTLVPQARDEVKKIIEEINQANARLDRHRRNLVGRYQRNSALPLAATYNNGNSGRNNGMGIPAKKPRKAVHYNVPAVALSKQLRLFPDEIFNQEGGFEGLIFNEEYWGDTREHSGDSDTGKLGHDPAQKLNDRMNRLDAMIGETGQATTSIANRNGEDPILRGSLVPSNDSSGLTLFERIPDRRLTGIGWLIQLSGGVPGLSEKYEKPAVAKNTTADPTDVLFDLGGQIFNAGIKVFDVVIKPLNWLIDLLVDLCVWVTDQRNNRSRREFIQFLRSSYEKNPPPERSELRTKEESGEIQAPSTYKTENDIKARIKALRDPRVFFQNLNGQVSLEKLHVSDSAGGAYFLIVRNHQNEIALIVLDNDGRWIDIMNPHVQDENLKEPLSQSADGKWRFVENEKKYALSLNGEVLVQIEKRWISGLSITRPNTKNVKIYLGNLEVKTLWSKVKMKDIDYETIQKSIAKSIAMISPIENRSSRSEIRTATITKKRKRKPSTRNKEQEIKVIAQLFLENRLVPSDARLAEETLFDDPEFFFKAARREAENYLQEVRNKIQANSLRKTQPEFTYEMALWALDHLTNIFSPHIRANLGYGVDIAPDSVASFRKMLESRNIPGLSLLFVPPSLEVRAKNIHVQLVGDIDAMRRPNFAISNPDAIPVLAGFTGRQYKNSRLIVVRNDGLIENEPYFEVVSHFFEMLLGGTAASQISKAGDAQALKEGVFKAINTQLGNTWSYGPDRNREFIVHQKQLRDSLTRLFNEAIAGKATSASA